MTETYFNSSSALVSRLTICSVQSSNSNNRFCIRGRINQFVRKTAYNLPRRRSKKPHCSTHANHGVPRKIKSSINHDCPEKNSTPCLQKPAVRCSWSIFTSGRFVRRYCTLFVIPFISPTAVDLWHMCRARSVCMMRVQNFRTAPINAAHRAHKTSNT